MSKIFWLNLGLENNLSYPLTVLMHRKLFAASGLLVLLDNSVVRKVMYYSMSVCLRIFYHLLNNSLTQLILSDYMVLSFHIWIMTEFVQQSFKALLSKGKVTR